MLLEEEGEDELPEKYKMSALKQLLVGDIRKHIELREQELKTYSEMRHAIMAWAINKRLEKERENRGDPMDVGNVNNGGGGTLPTTNGDAGSWSNYGNAGNIGG